MPTISAVDARDGDIVSVWINDDKHFDDFAPARIICARCKRTIQAMRGEVMVICPHCMMVNRGYGTNERGDPIVPEERS